jgi:hypothetical protein
MPPPDEPPGIPPPDEPPLLPPAPAPPPPTETAQPTTSTAAIAAIRTKPDRMIRARFWMTVFMLFVPHLRVTCA